MKLFTVLLCLIPYAGVLGVLQVQRLPCRLTDEYVWTNAEGHIETKNIDRDAVLQFDNSGNSALLSDSITFLVAAVMVLMTHSPSVRVGLQKNTTLHCQFAVDHKVPHLKVEWHLQRHGWRVTKLFSYSRISGHTEGSGVAVKGIAGGDASLTVPLTEVSSEGKYVCSVRVPPLNGSVDIALNVIAPPRVSLTTKEEQIPRVVCEANGFYPLDVEIDLFKETSSGQRPEKLKKVVHSSHRQHHDGTHSLEAFVRLRPSPLDSGCAVYSCRVYWQGQYINKSINGPGCLTWIHLTLPGLVCLVVVIIIFRAVTRQRYSYGNKTVTRR